MRKIALFALMISITILSFSQEEMKSDKEAIKKLVQTAYIDGLQNKGDLDQTRSGFHPGFNLLIMKNGMLEKLPIYNWIVYAEMKKAKDPDPPSEEEKVTCEFLDIDITGTAAVVKLKFLKGGKHIYTDYLSLYKFEDSWKIVSKIFYKLPEE
jgi:hypothetical protein